MTLKLCAAFFIMAVLAVSLPAAALAGPVRLGVLQWKVNSSEDIGFLKDALPEMLSSRIGSGGVVEVIGGKLLAGAVPEAKSGADEAVLVEAGRKLGLDYVLYGSITKLGSSISIDLNLFSVKGKWTELFYAKGDSLESIEGLTERLANDIITYTGAAKKNNEPPVAATPSGDFIVKTEHKALPDIWKSGYIEGEALAIEAADLDRDGVKEFFILRKNSLSIVRAGEDKLDVVSEIRAENNIRNIALSIVDSDSDGSAEVYVSGVRHGTGVASVIEYDKTEKAYKTTITGVRLLIRAFDKNTLIGQGFRPDDGFYGALRILKKEGSVLIDKGPFEIPLPRGADIYRFNLLSIGAGEKTLIVLDSRGYLRLYKDNKASWEEFWRSEDFYGGTLNLLESEEYGASSPESTVVFVEGRFLKPDNGQGLVIKRNIPGGLGRYSAVVRSYVKGGVIGIRWDKGSFIEDWKTREVKGYIADFFIDDLDNDGVKELVMLVVEDGAGYSGKAKSYILSSRLPV
ncbi:MAG: VCBS repeat-containing protein [Deltaproteobacteria bacterium]|nr:VCBS repeat-containing protein [Deltaproteobacteria bacterium]